MEVAVVIPAYNEARDLGACLDTLATQTLPHEIVVVDDGSADATAAIAEARGVPVLRVEHGGPAIARNHGAAETSAPILAFLDADMTFAPDFLELLVAPITREGAIGTFTRDELISNMDNRWARHGNPAGRRMPADHPDESSVFRAIRRDAFERAGGYDDVGCGEDTTIAAKLGVAAVRAEGAVCWHRNPDRLSEVFASARWYGKSDMTPRTAANWLRYFPVVALARAIRSGLERRSLSYAVFLFATYLGTFAGFVERDLLGRDHSR